jgi:hypothetical protein
MLVVMMEAIAASWVRRIWFDFLRMNKKFSIKIYGIDNLMVIIHFHHGQLHWVGVLI